MSKQNTAIADALKETAAELDEQRVDMREGFGELNESLLEIKIMLTTVITNQENLSKDFDIYKKSHNEEMAILRRKLNNGTSTLTQ